MERIVIEIEKEKKKKLKDLAYKQDTTMKSLIASAIESLLKTK